MRYNFKMYNFEKLQPVSTRALVAYYPGRAELCWHAQSRWCDKWGACRVHQLTLRDTAWHVTRDSVWSVVTLITPSSHAAKHNNTSRSPRNFKSVQLLSHCVQCYCLLVTARLQCGGRMVSVNTVMIPCCLCWGMMSAAVSRRDWWWFEWREAAACCGVVVLRRAVNWTSRNLTRPGEGPYYSPFSLLKVPSSDFTVKNLWRHCTKQAFKQDEYTIKTEVGLWWSLLTRAEND